jgi:fluoride ion exporter CrcB/FEX
MSESSIGFIVFACVFGGAVIGLALRGLLPQHHLSQETKDTVKLGTGLIGTMAALVLGLLVASAKSAYDSKKDEITRMSADMLILDRVLAHYGPEAKEARELLRHRW